MIFHTAFSSEPLRHDPSLEYCAVGVMWRQVKATFTRWRDSKSLFFLLTCSSDFVFYSFFAANAIVYNCSTPKFSFQAHLVFPLAWIMFLSSSEHNSIKNFNKSHQILFFKKIPQRVPLPLRCHVRSAWRDLWLRLPRHLRRGLGESAMDGGRGPGRRDAEDRTGMLLK